MLATHMMSNMKIRRTEQRRDALLARLKVDTDQLLGKQGGGGGGEREGMAQLGEHSPPTNVAQV